MSCGPIPRSAIKSYAAECGIDGDWFEVFHRIIRGMDSEFLTLNSPAKQEHLANTVQADDTEGVKALFGRVQARAKKATRKPTKALN